MTFHEQKIIRTEKQGWKFFLVKYNSLLEQSEAKTEQYSETLLNEKPNDQFIL